MRSNIYVERAKRNIADIRSKTEKLFKKSAHMTFKGKKYTFYPVKLAFILVLALVIISLLMAVFSLGNRTKKVDIPFEYGSSYNVFTADDSVMVYNNRGVKAISNDGKIRWEIDEALSKPLIDADGKYTLICDLAGNHFSASYKNGKKVQEYNLGNDIISAKITESGYVAFATDTDGYKGKATVLNKRGRELYVWNSGAGYITDIDITDNGRYLIVAQFLEGEEGALSKLQFIDTGRGEVVGTAEHKDEVVVNLRLVNDNKLLAVTERSIYCYNKKGRELFCISLAGKNPELYDIDSDELIAVSTFDNRGNSVIEIYNTSGKFCGSYTSDGGIRRLAVSGNRVAVSEQRGIVSISPRGKVKNVIPMEHDIIAIGGFKNDESVIAIGTMQAEVINL